MNHACIFDRDGVILRAFPDGDTTRGPRTRDEVELLPDAADQIRRLRDAGLLAVVVSNQPDIARGLTSWSEQLAINYSLLLGANVSVAYLCPHGPESHCCCRKPAPGLLYHAAVALSIVLPDSWMIGDRETDREAAIRAGIPQSQAIKIETNQSIKEAVDWILANST